MINRNTITCADALTYLQGLPDESVNCACTSPPYFSLRNYGEDGQIGLNQSLDEYVESLVLVFRELRRVLRSDGSFFLNLGDSYGRGTRPLWAGDAHRQGGIEHEVVDTDNYGHGTVLPNKQLMGIPWRVAFALQADGWYLRSDSPWVKKSSKPESCKDRATLAHEHIFHFSKSEHYWFNIAGWAKPHAESSIGRAIRGRSNHNKFADAGATVPGSKPQGMNGAKEHMGDVNAEEAVANGDTLLNPFGRNRRTTDPFFEGIDVAIQQLRDEIAALKALKEGKGAWWDEDRLLAVVTTSEPNPYSHYAAFPKQLIEPLIAASCPPFVCSVCGTPHNPIVERPKFNELNPDRKYGADTTDVRDGERNLSGNAHNRFKEEHPDTLIGYEPGCQCGGGTVHGLVLDMFMGSGTTAIASKKLRRDFIGCDLSAEYVHIAEQRLLGVGPDVETVDTFEGLPLFEGLE